MSRGSIDKATAQAAIMTTCLLKVRTRLAHEQDAPWGCITGCVRCYIEATIKQIQPEVDEFITTRVRVESAPAYHRVSWWERK